LSRNHPVRVCSPWVLAEVIGDQRNKIMPTEDVGAPPQDFYHGRRRHITLGHWGLGTLVDVGRYVVSRLAFVASLRADRDVEVEIVDGPFDRELRSIRIERGSR
jgi:hypothetical protein